MKYYKIPYTSGDTFTYSAGCVLCCMFCVNGYLYTKFEKVTEVGSNWVEITESEFNARRPSFPDSTPPVQEAIASAATLADGLLALTLPAPVDTGTLVKFDAPCTCRAVTGGIVIDGVTYSVVDALGNVVTGKVGAWDAGAQVAVLIDKGERKAYVQNSALPAGVVGMDSGGTGSSDGATGLKNLLASGYMVVSDYQLVNKLPTPGVKNRVFLMPVVSE